VVPHFASPQYPALVPPQSAGHDVEDSLEPQMLSPHVSVLHAVGQPALLYVQPDGHFE